MRRPTLKTVALTAVPLAGLLAFILTLVLRSDGDLEVLRRRENAELQALRSGKRESEGTDPEAALSQLRLAQRKASAGNPAAMSPARTQMLDHGAEAVPVLKAAVYRAGEDPLFRMECVGLLSGIPHPVAAAALLEILGDRTLEGRFRDVALARLAGRARSEAFPVLQRIYKEEPSYANRPLLVKAIGGCPQPESTALLKEAAREAPDPSVRIQAVEALSPRAADPEVLATLRDALFKAPEDNVRMAALGALGRSNSNYVNEILKEILENDNLPLLIRREAESWVERRKSR
jgi:HEAT repeat protein